MLIDSKVTCRPDGAWHPFRQPHVSLVRASAVVAAIVLAIALPCRAAIAGPVRAADQAQSLEAAPPSGLAERQAVTAAAGSASPAELELTLDETGALSASGQLPRELTRDDVGRILPGLGEGAALSSSGAGDAGEWVRGLEALSIVLPRLRSAEVRMGDDRLSMTGTLKRDFSASGAAAALRSALGRGWALDLDLAEMDPLPEVVFSSADDRVVLRGLLPRGLAPPEALDLLGTGAIGAGLAGGGGGDAQAWSRALVRLAESLRFFDEAAGRVTEGTLRIDGILRPGYGREAVQDYLRERIAEGWEAVVDAEETRPNEGDRRISLLTGEDENYRLGYWLPDARFPVSVERCRKEAGSALGNGLAFVDETARLTDGAEATIDRLAAVAIRCLNSSDLRLDIAVHTDSVGNDARNQRLTEDRAAAVRSALIARGVRRDALTATGYGESRPIATNDTAAGRAANRRLTFEFSKEGA